MKKIIYYLVATIMVTTFCCCTFWCGISFIEYGGDLHNCFMQFMGVLFIIIAVSVLFWVVRNKITY